MNNKPLTVTIGIPAYNEEANIGRLLDSIQFQVIKGFVLKQIIVISDGSSDRTASVVSSRIDRKIKLINSKERIGKSSRLNQLIQMMDSDVLVLFDGDVVLSNKMTLFNLISPFMNENNIGLVGGNLSPLPARSFVEQAVIITRQCYRTIRTKIRGGHNVFGCEGGALALSRFFAKTVTVPDDMIANDNYLYFSCLKEGYKFRHVLSAIVLYRTPSTLSDQLRQSKRFLAAHIRLKREFGKLAESEYFIPKSLLYSHMVAQLLRWPVHSFYIFLVNRYCKLLATGEERTMNALWPMAETTKKGVYVK